MQSMASGAGARVTDPVLNSIHSGMGRSGMVVGWDMGVRFGRAMHSTQHSVEQRLGVRG